MSYHITQIFVGTYGDIDLLSCMHKIYHHSHVCFYITLFTHYVRFSFSSCIDLHYCILFHELPHAPKLPYHFSYGKFLLFV